MAILRARSSLQLCSGDAPVGIPIAFTRRVPDLRRQRWWWRFSVPLSVLLQIGQVIAQRLLVEARLAASCLIAVGRPEARGVGRQDLVDDDQCAVRRRPEFEFRVGDDDAALRSIITAYLIQRETGATYALGHESTEATHDVVKGDVLVVPLFSFRRG